MPADTAPNQKNNSTGGADNDEEEFQVVVVDDETTRIHQPIGSTETGAVNNGNSPGGLVNQGFEADDEEEAEKQRQKNNNAINNGSGGGLLQEKKNNNNNHNNGLGAPELNNGDVELIPLTASVTLPSDQKAKKSPTNGSSNLTTTNIEKDSGGINNGNNAKSGGGNGGFGNDLYTKDYMSVNTRRKLFRGEKLYVTRDQRSHKRQWKWIAFWGGVCTFVAAALLTGILAATGIIMSKEENPSYSGAQSLHFANESENASDHSSQNLSTTVLLTTTTTATTSTTEDFTVSHINKEEPSTPAAPLFTIANTLEGDMKIVNLDFDAKFMNLSSPDAHSMALRLESELKKMFTPINIERAKVESFRPGSILVHFLLMWPEHESQVTANTVMGIFTDHVSFHGDTLGQYQISVNSFGVKELEDRCTVNRGGCSDLCEWRKEVMEFVCLCAPGWSLDHDGKTCIMGADETGKTTMGTPTHHEHSDGSFETTEHMDHDHLSTTSLLEWMLNRTHTGFGIAEDTHSDETTPTLHDLMTSAITTTPPAFTTTGTERSHDSSGKGRQLVFPPEDETETTSSSQAPSTTIFSFETHKTTTESFHHSEGFSFFDFNFTDFVDSTGHEMHTPTPTPTDINNVSTEDISTSDANDDDNNTTSSTESILTTSSTTESHWTHNLDIVTTDLILKHLLNATQFSDLGHNTDKMPPSILDFNHPLLPVFHNETMNESSSTESLEGTPITPSTTINSSSETDGEDDLLSHLSTLVVPSVTPDHEKSFTFGMPPGDHDHSSTTSESTPLNVTTSSEVHGRNLGAGVDAGEDMLTGATTISSEINETLSTLSSVDGSTEHGWNLFSTLLANLNEASIKSTSHEEVTGGSITPTTSHFTFGPSAINESENATTPVAEVPQSSTITTSDVLTTTSTTVAPAEATQNLSTVVTTTEMPLELATLVPETVTTSHHNVEETEQETPTTTSFLDSVTTGQITSAELTTEAPPTSRENKMLTDSEMQTTNTIDKLKKWATQSESPMEDLTTWVNALTTRYITQSILGSESANSTELSKSTPPMSSSEGVTTTPLPPEIKVSTQQGNQIDSVATESLGFSFTDLLTDDSTQSPQNSTEEMTSPNH